MASGPGAWPWPVEFKQAFVVLWIALCGILATWRAFKWMAGTSSELRSAKFLQLFREVCGIVTPGMGSVGPDTESCRALEASNREVERKRIARARFLLPFGMLGFMVGPGSILFGVNMPATFPQDCGIVVGICTATLLWVRPSMLTPTSLDLFYCLFMADLCFVVSPLAVDSDRAVFWFFATLIDAAALAAWNLRPWLNTLWLCILNTMACISLYSNERSACLSSVIGVWNEIALVTSLTILLSILIFVVNILWIEMVRSEHDALLSQTKLSAARSVLRCMCDVVVELDSSLQLKEDSQELRHFLFLNEQRSLHQKDMRTFLATDDDRSKFSERMLFGAGPGQPRAADDTTSAFHVCMLDSAGISLSVEMFVVPFVNRDWQQAFFLGIREFCDTQIPKLGAVSHGRHARSPAGVKVSSAEGTTKHESPPPSRTPSHVSEAELAVWVDVFSDAWTVKSVTDGLRFSIGGFDPSDCYFLEWIRPAQREQCIAVAQEFAVQEDTVATGKLAESVDLQNSYMKRCGLYCTARVDLDRSPDPGHLGNPDPDAVDGVLRFTLKNLCWRKARGAQRIMRHLGTPPTNALGLPQHGDPDRTGLPQHVSL